jgi:hypothetical protein
LIAENPMAFCPRCSRAIDAAETICPGCGYDFPMPGTEPSIRRNGFAYSPFAAALLVGGTIAAGLGCVWSVAVLFFGLWSREFAWGLVGGTFGFFLFGGLLVTFLRAQER